MKASYYQQFAPEKAEDPKRKIQIPTESILEMFLLLVSGKVTPLIRPRKHPRFFSQLHMGVSKNSGTPKWMVKIMKNPIKMDDLGYKVGPLPVLSMVISPLIGVITPVTQL